MTLDCLSREQLDLLRQHMSPLKKTNTPIKKDSARAEYLRAYQLDLTEEYNEKVSYMGGRLPSSQKTVSCHLWLQQETTGKGTVILVHGYYDHTGLYGRLIRFFLQQGYSVFAYDQPGHGLSDGEPATIDSFATYAHILQLCLDWCTCEQLPQPFHLAGQSMGGAVITELLRTQGSKGHQLPLESLIFLAPLIRPTRWWWGRIQYLAARLFLKQIPRTKSVNSHDERFLEFLHKDPLQARVLPVAWVGAMHRWIQTIEQVGQICNLPAFIVQGKQDGTVDWQHNMRVYRRLYPRAQVLYIQKARHNLVNEMTSLRRHYQAWLVEKMQCPRQAEN
ncbi:MAG: alpha/beta fold hydrolase [Kistimonas sp.]|nr:alpha/beta fold hydrolase [Kistimonas sp.]